MNNLWDVTFTMISIVGSIAGATRTLSAACDLPLSRFPQGASRGGRVPPTPQNRRLPPQEGSQSAPLKSPLCIPLGVHTPRTVKGLSCYR